MHFKLCRKHPLIHLREKDVSPQLPRGYHLVEWGRQYYWLLQPIFSLLDFLISLICTNHICRSGSISRGFRGEFKHWQIIPGSCEGSPVMTNQFSVILGSLLSFGPNIYALLIISFPILDLCCILEQNHLSLFFIHFIMGFTYCSFLIVSIIRFH